MPKHNNLTRTNILRMMRAKLSTGERNNKKNKKNNTKISVSNLTRSNIIRMMRTKLSSQERTRRNTKAAPAQRGGKRTRRR